MARRRAGRTRHAIRKKADHVRRCRIEPVQILEQDQHRALARKADQLVDERLEGSGPERRGAQLRWAITPVGRQAEQGGEQRDERAGIGDGAAEQVLELLQLVRRGLAARDPRGAAKLLDDWEQCGPGVMRRAEVP